VLIIDIEELIWGLNTILVLFQYLVGLLCLSSVSFFLSLFMVKEYLLIAICTVPYAFCVPSSNFFCSCLENTTEKITQ